MKNIYKIVLLFMVAAFVSCDEDLDINTDPNSPEDINSGLALASAQASLVTILGGDFSNLGGFYAQYHTQGPNASQYQNIDEYNINTSYADRPWSEIYSGCLSDLEYVLDKSAADNQTADALIATCLKAYTFQLMTDIFGDIPYTEALQGSANITPAVTPGEEIYADLIVKIDEALAAYNAEPMESSVGSQDVIYNGDAESWVKFANTLKLKMYIRMSYTPMANPAAVNALMAEGNFIDEDAKFDIFEDTATKRNPFYEVQVVFLGDVNNVASNSLHSFYVENDDPRLEFVYKPNTAGAFVSIAQGSFGAINITAQNFSRPNITAETPVYLMTVAESLFLQAEGAVRYGGGAGAQDLYNAGVAASFTTYASDFTDQDGEPIMSVADAVAAANALTGAGGNYEYVAGGGVEAEVRQIMIQKWASLAYVNNMEAWIETTRTKYPEIVPEDEVDYAEGNRIPSQVSVLPGLTVPSIIYYPDDEVNRNPNVVQHASLTEKVWWDQK